MVALARIEPHELPFADFADAVKLSSGVNRVEGVAETGGGLSYSVYFNGDFARTLPADMVEQTIEPHRAQRVAAVIPGLEADSPRDLLFAAELLAVRGAWMAAVMDASSHGGGQALQQDVLDDYANLANGFEHPWVAAQVAQHRGQVAKLPEVLAAASAVAGRALPDQIPEELSRGTVVAQSPEFTVQATAGGVVTHDNRRLSSVPMVGSDVTVVYYKGQGQVFEHGQALFSEPFIEPASGDLAMRVTDQETKAQKLVLFNSMTAFAQLVEAQGLDKRLVGQAMDLRAAAPKVVGGELPPGVRLAGDGRFIGKVVGIDQKFVVQEGRQGELIGHRLTDFAERPVLGSTLDIQRGKGQVVVKDAGKGQAVGVTR